MRTFGLAVTLLLAACGNGERPASRAGSEAIAKPTLRLAIVTDLQGQLEPCGCQSRPLGGVDRLATAVQRLRGDGTPTLLLFAGDLLFGGEPAHGPDMGPDADAQDVWRAETLVEILNRVGAVAVIPGAADASRPVTTVGPLLTRLSARSLLAPSPGSPELSSHMLEVGGTKVAIFGVGVDVDASVVAERAVVVANVKRLRDAGAAIVIALVSGERTTANQVARIAGVDFVVSGGIDNQHPNPPTPTGNSHVLMAGRQGEGLLTVDIYRVGEGPYSDASPWSRERNRQALARSIDDLASRIADWERQPTIDRTALDEQKARLAALEKQRVAPAVAPAGGNRFVASWVEIDESIARDATVEGVIDAYNRRVNQHNRVALAGVKAPEVGPGQPHYVGASQCESCHHQAFSWWTEHAHGRAYATLEKVNKEFNLSCVGCHVTGYNRPGGSTVVQNAGLTNVGCESCHGPGSQHVDDPDAEPYSVQRVVPESICVGCHNPEHSDKFNYDKYREKLLVRGHGRPAVAVPVATP
jgi:hypothetical protein